MIVYRNPESNSYFDGKGLHDYKIQFVVYYIPRSKNCR